MLARIRKSAEEKDQGFTLIELLVVIIIIGILAAIAIPVFLRQREKGWDAAAKADLKNMATAEETYLTDNDVYTASVADLETNGFKKSTGDVTAWTAKTIGATTSSGYCLSATSRSTKVYYYSSDVGVPNTTAC
jgi:type IV pilus assembly protein PilA